MRILIVTSRLPFPPSWGAAARDYQLARHLARRHQVTMLCYASANEAEPAAQLGRELDRVVTVPWRDKSPITRRVSQAKTLLSAEPFATSEGRDASMQRALGSLLSEQSFDLVQIESVRMNSLSLPADLLRVVDEHNVEYELLRRMSRGERSPARRVFNAIEHVKLRRVEMAAWRQASACLVTSDREAAIVRTLAPATPTLTVPNGVDIDYFRPSGAEPVRDSLVFTGNLSYRPNIDAVHYLVEEVFPLITRRRPACSLTIVGGGEGSLRRLERPGVRFTGWVPDLRPYLDQAAVVVVPVRIGSGTRLKVVEAFAAGKAVVSTTLGAEGIDATHGQHLLLADDRSAFADQAISLLAEPAEARRLGAAAAALARELYSWDRVASSLEEFYLELIAGAVALTS